MPQLTKYFIAAGIVLILLGIFIWLFGNKFHWFGNLPGDIKVESENFKFYFPITSMILLSIILSIMIWLFRKIF